MTNDPTMARAEQLARSLLNEHGPDAFNLYASREGIAVLANELSGILDDIEMDRRSRKHVRPGISPPRDVKRAAYEALEQCSERSIAPPVELCELIKRLLSVSDDERRRDGIDGVRNRDLFRLAKRIHKETKLTGRPLAREMRARGIADASDKTISNWTKLLRQKAK